MALAKLRLTPVVDLPSAAQAAIDIQTYLNQMGVLGATLTAGTGLSGGSYNGTAAVTFAVDPTAFTINASQILHGTFGSATSDTGTYAFAGNVFAAGELHFTAVATTPGAGSIALMTANGLVMIGAAGATYDAAILTPFGQVALGVLSGTQDVAFSHAVTVAGALSATTGTFSGLVNGTAQQAIRTSGQGTGFQYFQMDNTGADNILGIESSAGGSLFTGSAAYSTVFGPASATALHFGTTAIVRMTIASGGGVNVLTDFSVNTSKFTVAASSGNTAIAGITTFGAPAGLKSYTVGTLPTGVQGYVAYCTDLLTPGFLTIAVGGGGVVGPVFYNGSNWVAF